MAAEGREEVRALIEALHERRLRVWSIVITFFGDAVVPRGGQVWLSVVSALMERLQISPGTLGAAMSRLTAERWLVREKVGRRTRYRLDDAGKQAFDEAARRVYGLDDDDWSGDWTLRLAVPGSNPEPWSDAGFGTLGPDLYVRPERSPGRPAPTGVTLATRPQVDDWPDLAARAFPVEEAEDRHARFEARMVPLRAALEAGATLSPDDAIVARTLLVHAYRRLVLRDPPLPPTAFPAGGYRERSRDWVSAVYRALIPASEAWLDRPPDVPEDASLPAPDPCFFMRFGGLKTTGGRLPTGQRQA